MCVRGGGVRGEVGDIFPSNLSTLIYGPTSQGLNLLMIFENFWTSNLISSIYSKSQNVDSKNNVNVCHCTHRMVHTTS